MQIYEITFYWQTIFIFVSKLISDEEFIIDRNCCPII